MPIMQKQTLQRNCSLPVHAECVTPLINAFKGSSNKCEKACDSRFYKQQTIMYGRLRRVLILESRRFKAYKVILITRSKDN